MTLYHGDLFDVLPTLPSASLDSCVTDPPYGLEFMGKEWDRLGTDTRQPGDATYTEGPGPYGRSKVRYGVGASYGHDAWRTGAGFSQPGIGDRPTPWTSYGQGDSANATCETCGGRMRGAKKCECAEPVWMVKGQPLTAAGVDSRQAQSRRMQDWHYAWACEVYRVLKPGAYLAAFGGTRTFHRLTCALEDAGFEIRDCLMWLYATGFPKSLDVSKAIDKRMGAERQVIGQRTDGPSSWMLDQKIEHRATAPASPEAQTWVGWGTALKPGWEPIILARKPLQGTVAQNVLTHGTGALNIDGCRITTDDNLNGGGYTPRANGNAWADTKGMNAEGRCAQVPFTQPDGRWPANVVLDEAAAKLVDQQSGELGVSSGVGAMASEGHIYGNGIGLVASVPKGNDAIGYGDQGGASRFFYCAKPDRTERDVGCAGLPAKSGGEATDRVDDTAGLNSPRSGAGRNGGARNIHPTVKPVDLMRWLVRLITPPKGTVIDPFMGSGTTGMACKLEQVDFVGIEREANYIQIAEQRIGAMAPLFDEQPIKAQVLTQAPLFE